MLELDALIYLFLLGVGIAFWRSNLAARESALRACSNSARQQDVQFLDQTVHLSRVRLGRSRDGRLHFRRFYHFEFSSDGQDRLTGLVVALGTVIEHVQMDLPDGSVIDQTDHQRSF